MRNLPFITASCAISAVLCVVGLTACDSHSRSTTKTQNSWSASQLAQYLQTKNADGKYPIADNKPDVAYCDGAIDLTKGATQVCTVVIDHNPPQKVTLEVDNVDGGVPVIVQVG